jgi:bacterioferritin
VSQKKYEIREYGLELHMKGNEKVLETLNMLLADELSAINQYIVHSEMCADWGFDELHEAIEKQAIDEMKHAEELIARILFLEGIPIVSNLNEINIGKDVKAMVEFDLAAETGAVKAYNDGIRICMDVGDEGSAELLRSILEDEETHTDWNEAQLEQIAQMGIENYLSMKVES